MERIRQQRVRRSRSQLLTAVAGLALVGAVLLYQVWDFRNAFVASDEWWAFFGPSFAGDDYIAATLDAEQVDDLHRYYRSIAVVTGARRMAGGRVAEIRAPEQLHLLWTTDPDDLGDFERPGFRDTALENWSSGAVVWSEYDPVVTGEAISGWRSVARFEELAWNVVAVETDEPADSFALHTDEGRVTVYVVPLALSPAGGGAP